MSIPTDCPQRNERLGWSGDISVFARTATYLANIPGFLRRHMLAMRNVQREDGRFSDVAPLGGGFGGVLWGSAGITVAWESYQQYGDKEMLAEHYDAMKHYIHFLQSGIDPKTNVLADKERANWASLGDWLSLEYDRTEKALLWEAYFVYDLELMTKMAAVLGYKDDLERFNKIYKERKAFFNNTYINPVTGKTIFRGNNIDNQASYAVPLALNVIADTFKMRITSNFTATVSRTNKADDGQQLPAYSLMTGFIGTAAILPALSKLEQQDAAYRLFRQTSYPSWLYSVKQGATTIWERLNSYTHTNGFGGNNRMNSFNHYSFGAVGAWMYNNSLGIQRDENSPGFKHFIFQPEPDPTGGLTYAKGHYESMYGRIESSWKIAHSNVLYHFAVPANTTATIYLKASAVDDILEQGRKLSALPGVTYLGFINGKHAFDVASGTYDLSVQRI